MDVAPGPASRDRIARNLESPGSSNAESDADIDGALIARARAGDGEALDGLVVRHQDRVYNMAFRILGDREDALDVAQEVFLTVHRTIARFEARARFSTWLYRVTVNRCRDELRRRASRKHARPRSLNALTRGSDGDDDRGWEPAASGPSPQEMASSGEMGHWIAAAIAALPEDAREVLVLRDVEECAYEEIAEVLSIPVGTVRSRLHRARGLLRDRLRPRLEAES